MTADAEPARPRAENVGPGPGKQPHPLPSSIADGVSVAVVDDHPMVADSVAHALNATETITVLAIALTCATGLAAVAEHRPDVVLLDQYLPDGLGTDVLPEMLAAAPGTKALILTGQDIDDVLTRAVRAGAAGVITKDNRAAAIVSAVRAVARDEAVLIPEALRRLTWNNVALGDDLTARERAVLQFMVAGFGTRGTASALRMAPAVARHHIQAVINKLGARNRLEAVAISIRTESDGPARNS